MDDTVMEEYLLPACVTYLCGHKNEGPLMEEEKKTQAVSPVTGLEAWDVALPTSTASEGGAKETGTIDRGIAIGALGLSALIAGL